jgi:hypothetical protein
MVTSQEQLLERSHYFGFFFRLKCFYALTNTGKRIDLVDDRLRGKSGHFVTDGLFVL